MYEFGGEFFIQTVGGPIGLSLSGAIGRTTMAVWDGEVGRLCRRKGIIMRFRRRYMDDCNGAMQSWRKGWRWGRKDGVEEEMGEGGNAINGGR